MHRRIVFPALLASLTAVSGCDHGLMQDQQAVVIRFDESSKKLMCLMVYQGLHAGGTESEQSSSLAQAKQDLGEFVASGRKLGLFLFGRINLFEVGKSPEVDPTTAEAIRPFVESIRVKNLGFFVDPKLGLCAEQAIEVGDRDELARVINVLLSRAIDDGSTKELARLDTGGSPPPEPGFFDRSALASLREAARSGHPWLAITPGRFELRLPMTEADAGSALRKIEGAPRPDERALIPALKAAVEGFDIQAGSGGLIVRMGDGQKRSIAVLQEVAKKHDPARDGSLIDFAKTLGLPFEESRTVEATVRAFEAK